MLYTDSSPSRKPGKPPVLDTDVLYFGATDNSSGSQELIVASNCECWRQTTRGQFDVYPAAGNHCSIVLRADEFGVIGRALAQRVALLRNPAWIPSPDSTKSGTEDFQTC